MRNPGVGLAHLGFSIDLLSQPLRWRCKNGMATPIVMLFLTFAAADRMKSPCGRYNFSTYFGGFFCWSQLWYL